MVSRQLFHFQCLIFSESLKISKNATFFLKMLFEKEQGFTAEILNLHFLLRFIKSSKRVDT